MRLMTIIACALLCTLSVSCLETPSERGPTGRNDSIVTESVGAVVAQPAPTGTCSCNPAPDSVNGWVIATNPDGTNKENCSKCTSSSLCTTGFCYYKNAVGSEQDVKCQWASRTIPHEPTEPAPIEPGN